ncbi:LpqN/LpqT family lipoprotein [Rhodococcus sp. SGAir0479]|uniref:LpqN/LpqT family lipoprotein n=1 Tax=Rhodococcus sp. SGAir0479 TaxID=2567884 RepID=UPI0020C7FE35|nr:LpqN/LpqT family lipoprotein [Rhodococcus sp. SGAir0479]
MTLGDHAGGRGGRGALQDFLDGKGLRCSPCSAGDPGVPAVTVPVLPGWTRLASESFPGAWLVLTAPDAQSNVFTANAVVLHGELSERAGVDDLLDAARRSSTLLPEWREDEVSFADFHGQRSLFVSGVSTVGDSTFAVTSRFVVVERSRRQYLTQLTVTTFAERSEALATDVMVINSALDIQV